MISATARNLETEIEVSLDELKSVIATKMALDDKAECLLGTLSKLISIIEYSVVDWSLPKPAIPIYAWQAWNKARIICEGYFDNIGMTCFSEASNILKNNLKAGYWFHREDIY